MVWFALSCRDWMINYKWIRVRNAFIDILQGCFAANHYGDVMMSAMASQINSLTIVY